MKSQYLAALTYIPVPNTALFSKYESWEFTLPDPFETLEEMKLIFENIDIENLKFIGAHASNYLPISGTLQKDKADMLSKVNQVLSLRDMGTLRSEGTRGL